MVPDPEVRTETPSRPQPPDWDEFWAHQVAEKAKAKVLAYFGIMGAIVSILLTLYGMDGIRTLLDTKFSKVVEAREKGASDRVDAKLKEFEKELDTLRSTVRTRTDEYLQVLVLPPNYRAQVAVAQTSSVDFSDQIGAIGDQGPEGTTVGFSVAYALQAEIRRQRGLTVQLSPRSIYTLAKEYDEWPGRDYDGTSVAAALKALKQVGAYLEVDWPYKKRSRPPPDVKPAHQIAGSTEVKGIAGIKDALRAGHPVVVTITATDDFDKTDKSGRVTLKLPQRELLGGHSVCITAYFSKNAEFKFANMWGKSWGAAGFGLIRESDLQKILISAHTLKL